MRFLNNALYLAVLTKKIQYRFRFATTFFPPERQATQMAIRFPVQT